MQKKIVRRSITIDFRVSNVLRLIGTRDKPTNMRWIREAANKELVPGYSNNGMKKLLTQMSKAGLLKIYASPHDSNLHRFEITPLGSKHAWMKKEDKPVEMMEGITGNVNENFKKNRTTSSSSPEDSESDSTGS